VCSSDLNRPHDVEGTKLAIASFIAFFYLFTEFEYKFRVQIDETINIRRTLHM
jgi:hypothetical protein